MSEALSGARSETNGADEINSPAHAGNVGHPAHAGKVKSPVNEGAVGSPARAGAEGGARRGLGWRAAYLFAALAVFLLDQTSKAWAVRTLRSGSDRTVIEGFLTFAYAENPGVAFGQLQGGGAFGRWFLVVLAAMAAVAVLVYFFRTPRSDDRILGACALLLAGIAGNLTDRLRLGHVVDFILLHAGSYHWPTFNVADAAICTGAFLLAFDILREGRKSRQS
ncbi:MAG TPA: signal peptidase II [Pyrinomonadaceae bacterium]|nr:signal peptidase II [Pyrinomonadaceae bacterium]